jgi:hypothetical protein
MFRLQVLADQFGEERDRAERACPAMGSGMSARAAPELLANIGALIIAHRVGRKDDEALVARRAGWGSLVVGDGGSHARCRQGGCGRIQAYFAHGKRIPSLISPGAGDVLPASDRNTGRSLHVHNARIATGVQWPALATSSQAESGR